jgi:hypothetical protein
MFSTGDVVSNVKTELDFKDLSTLKFTSYSRLLDKQLCQYLALNKNTNINEKREKETIETLLRINIYSITAKHVAINDCRIIKDNQVHSKEDYTGCVILQTKTKNDISIADININESVQQKLSLQYGVSDLIILGKNTTICLPSNQELLVFNIKECSETEWIDTLSLAIKPTR